MISEILRSIVRRSASATVLVTTILVSAPQFAAAAAAPTTDLLAHAKQLAVPAKAYPELTQINEQVAIMITRMEASANQLKEFRKQRIRGSDRRFSQLTRDLNQSRSRLSEIERKLDKAPTLDPYRFPAPSGGDRGTSSSDVRERAMASENKKYDEAKSQLRLGLKAISDHYDQQLKEIAKIR
jgi:hypothetical protein